jgi:hypothetical protein
MAAVPSNSHCPVSGTTVYSNPTPTVRKAGYYQVHVSTAQTGRDGRCVVYRDGRLLTMARACSAAAAVTEARRNVRNARKCGGLL